MIGMQVIVHLWWVNHRGGSPKWILGVVSAVQGPVTVLAKFGDGRENRYHIDHIRSCDVRGSTEEE